MTLYKNKRRVAWFLCTFGTCLAGYAFCGINKQLYTMGYQNHFVQPVDLSLHLMNALGADESAKLKLDMLTLLQDALDSQGRKLDTLDWLMMGSQFAKQSEEETSFQCYYLAHLLDHERIGTNSKLKFETNGVATPPPMAPPSTGTQS